MFAALVGAVPALLGQGQIEHEFGGGIGLAKEPDLMLKPDLAVFGLGVVGEQVNRRGRTLGEMGLKCRQQTTKLLLRIEPDADPRPLLVGETLLDLGEKGGGEHEADEQGFLTADGADGRGLDGGFVEQVAEEGAEYSHPWLFFGRGIHPAIVGNGHLDRLTRF